MFSGTMATLGLVRGRGPPRSGGKDGVGTCSDVTGLNLSYARHIYKAGTKGINPIPLEKIHMSSMWHN